MGRVGAKLVGMGTIQGLVSGNFGELSEDTNLLVAAMENSSVRVAGEDAGGGGQAVSAIQCCLGVMKVHCQASSLLGRLKLWEVRQLLAASGRPHVSTGAVNRRTRPTPWPAGRVTGL